jgi:hypothetical protein
MSQKANPALRAEDHAVLQARMRLQYRVQRDLILPDKRPGAIKFMPIRPKRENSLDGDDKKARFSVITRSRFDTPSSYRLEAKAPRGGARFFCAITEIRQATSRANDPQRIARPSRKLRPRRHIPDALPSLNRLLGKKNRPTRFFSFQVVAHFT